MRAAKRVVRLVLGWFFIALGVAGIAIPVFPQIPFLALGALLLAPHVRIFRRMSAWLHKKYPKWRGPMRRFRIIKKRTRPAAPPCDGPGANI